MFLCYKPKNENDWVSGNRQSDQHGEVNASVTIVGNRDNFSFQKKYSACYYLSCRYGKKFEGSYKGRRVI